MTKRIGLYLYHEVEVLDFAGPFEVFNTANRLALRQNPSEEMPFEVLTISRQPGIVLARGGLPVMPAYTIDNAPSLQVLMVPGGIVDVEMANPELLSWLRRVSAEAEISASVCTGAFLLAQAGVLGNRPVTTHWEDIPDLRQRFPSLQVRENARWVDDGAVVTAAGISAGIDMSLHLVERIAGRDLAVRTAKQMEYVWNEG